MQDAAAFGAGVQGQGAGDAVIGVNAEDEEMMQSAVALGELALRGDSLPLALFFGADAEVEGDGHAHPFLTRRGWKSKSMPRLRRCGGS